MRHVERAVGEALMTMDPEPLRSPPLCEDSGGGGTHKRKEEEQTVVMVMVMVMVMEGRKKKTVKDGSTSIKCEDPMLTPAQFSEFQRQVLIFEHMKAGLPAPCHVLMPIWEEVASSFGSDRSGVYNLYPSLSIAGLGWESWSKS